MSRGWREVSAPDRAKHTVLSCDKCGEIVAWAWSRRTQGYYTCTISKGYAQPWNPHRCEEQA